MYLVSVKDFQFFNQWEAIFNIRQGQWSQFWKMGIQRVSHQSLVQFDPVVLEKIKMWKFNGWQTTDTKWWEKLIWTFGPSELKTFMRTIKWTLLPHFNIIVPVVSGKRLKCKSLRTTGRDGQWW
jgi:hypothetical protein